MGETMGFKQKGNKAGKADNSGMSLTDRLFARVRELKNIPLEEVVHGILESDKSVAKVVANIARNTSFTVESETISLDRYIRVKEASKIYSKKEGITSADLIQYISETPAMRKREAIANFFGATLYTITKRYEEPEWNKTKDSFRSDDEWQIYLKQREEEVERRISDITQKNSVKFLAMKGKDLDAAKKQLRSEIDAEMKRTFDVYGIDSEVLKIVEYQIATESALADPVFPESFSREQKDAEFREQTEVIRKYAGEAIEFIMPNAGKIMASKKKDEASREKGELDILAIVPEAKLLAEIVSREGAHVAKQYINAAELLSDDAAESITNHETYSSRLEKKRDEVPGFEDRLSEMQAAYEQVEDEEALKAAEEDLNQAQSDLSDLLEEIQALEDTIARSEEHIQTSTSEVAEKQSEKVAQENQLMIVEMDQVPVHYAQRHMDMPKIDVKKAAKLKKEQDAIKKADKDAVYALTVQVVNPLVAEEEDRFFDREKTKAGLREFALDKLRTAGERELVPQQRRLNRIIEREEIEGMNLIDVWRQKHAVTALSTTLYRPLNYVAGTKLGKAVLPVLAAGAMVFNPINFGFLNTTYQPLEKVGMRIVKDVHGGFVRGPKIEVSLGRWAASEAFDQIAMAADYSVAQTEEQLDRVEKKVNFKLDLAQDTIESNTEAINTGLEETQTAVTTGLEETRTTVSGVNDGVSKAKNVTAFNQKQTNKLLRELKKEVEKLKEKVR